MLRPARDAGVLDGALLVQLRKYGQGWRFANQGVHVEVNAPNLPAPLKGITDAWGEAHFVDERLRGVASVRVGDLVVPDVDTDTVELAPYWDWLSASSSLPPSTTRLFVRGSATRNQHVSFSGVLTLSSVGGGPFIPSGLHAVGTDDDSLSQRGTLAAFATYSSAYDVRRTRAIGLVRGVVTDRRDYTNRFDIDVDDVGACTGGRDIAVDVDWGDGDADLLGIRLHLRLKNGHWASFPESFTVNGATTLHIPAVQPGAGDLYASFQFYRVTSEPLRQPVPLNFDDDGRLRLPPQMMAVLKDGPGRFNLKLWIEGDDGAVWLQYVDVGDESVAIRGLRPPHVEQGEGRIVSISARNRVGFFADLSTGDDVIRVGPPRPSVVIKSGDGWVAEVRRRRPIQSGEYNVVSLPLSTHVLAPGSLQVFPLFGEPGWPLQENEPPVEIDALPAEFIWATNVVTRDGKRPQIDKLDPAHLKQSTFVAYEPEREAYDEAAPKEPSIVPIFGRAQR